jgi:hypothetical protein
MEDIKSSKGEREVLAERLASGGRQPPGYVDEENVFVNREKPGG